MLCNICCSDVQQTFKLTDLKETCSILFQTNIESLEVEVKICCWCRRTIRNVDRFRRRAMQAQSYYMNGAISNYTFQPQNFYDLQVKNNVEQYDITIQKDDYLSQVRSRTDIIDSRNNCKTREIMLKDEPEFDTDDDQPIGSESLQVEISPEVVSHSKSDRKKKKYDQSQLIELNSFWMLRSSLVPRHKTEKYQCSLLTDNEILNEKKLKLERLQSDDIEFKCLLCLEIYEDQEKLTEHISVHTNKPKTVLCKFCNIWIEDDQNAVLTHYRKHYVRYKCNNCTYMCENLKDIQFHFVNQHKDLVCEKKKPEYKCKRCGEVFTTGGNKQYHIDTVHKNIIHQCDECKKVFKSYTKLKRHKEIHKNEFFTCDDCGKTVKNKISFDNHKKQHIKEATGVIQSILCHVCNKTFKNKLTYRKHLERTSNHQGNRKQYKCPHCEKPFLDERSMEEHKNLAHLGGGVACNICGKMFTRKSNLKKHITETHGDKSMRTRDYVCDHCGKGFYAKIQMKEHARIHSDERPLQCNFCNATFKYKAALFTHNRLVHEKFKRNTNKTKQAELPFYPNYY